MIKGEIIKALKAAFPKTIPVMAGFTFLGIAFGILMNSKGYGFIWAVLMSLFVFAGSAQYVAVTFLTSAFNPLYAILITIIVNARHLFYGISLLGKYSETGKLKPYLIFGLCDETFSIICSSEPPASVNANLYYLSITLLDHLYWVAGTAIGGLLGYMVTFNTKGLDFALTALFTVIFADQWKTSQNRKPAAIGVGCSIVCLLIFGRNGFIIPSMICILIILTAMRRNQATKETTKC